MRPQDLLEQSVAALAREPVLTPDHIERVVVLLQVCELRLQADTLARGLGAAPAPVQED